MSRTEDARAWEAAARSAAREMRTLKRELHGAHRRLDAVRALHRPDFNGGCSCDTVELPCPTREAIR